MIDAHGGGGFRFAGMSHRGSLICLPAGIWTWPVADVAALDEAAFAPIFACAGDLDFFVLGTGAQPWAMPPALRGRLRGAGLAVDVMTTGAAVRTYNVMLMEGRRVAAGLIAVG